MPWVSMNSTILEMSPRTVNKHLERVYKKLGVDNRTSAAASDFFLVRCLSIAFGSKLRDGGRALFYPLPLEVNRTNQTMKHLENLSRLSPPPFFSMMINLVKGTMAKWTAICVRLLIHFFTYEVSFFIQNTQYVVCNIYGFPVLFRCSIYIKIIIFVGVLRVGY